MKLEWNRNNATFTLTLVMSLYNNRDVELINFTGSFYTLALGYDVKRRPIRQRQTILTKAGHVSSILTMRIFVFYCAPAE
jgi:hypothetical protein